MSINRLEQLLNFLNDEPNDPFNIYAVATEYLKTDYQKSLDLFLQLINEHPTYTATYYHLAKLYESLGKKSEAEEVYQKGIAMCKNTKAHHALSELQRAYNTFLFEDED